VRNFGPAEYIIKKYEGFNDKAYPDPLSDGVWTIGFGTQFYPDGSPVQQGHRITPEKAEEYLSDELHVIELDLLDLNLPLDQSMIQALVSFIHSVGWSAFFYSNIVDAMERNDVTCVVKEINKWIFDEDHKAIGGLVERRMEETTLFLTDVDDYFEPRIPNILLKAFRDYEASADEVQAIRRLESSISPYVLAEFANSFGLYGRKSFLSEFDADRIFDLPR
jgi:lysozyme